MSLRYWGYNRVVDMDRDCIVGLGCKAWRIKCSLVCVSVGFFLLFVCFFVLRGLDCKSTV